MTACDTNSKVKITVKRKKRKTTSSTITLLCYNYVHKVIVFELGSEEMTLNEIYPHLLLAQPGINKSSVFIITMPLDHELP